MRSPVRPVKALGQHFLKDPEIAGDIANTLIDEGTFDTVLEIGPGTGMLTRFLLERFGNRLHVIEVDNRSAEHLTNTFPELGNRIHRSDFLKFDIESLHAKGLAIIGNYPYNISSQILFRVLEYYVQVPMLAGMFQKEVAMRIASGPGSRDYGILSVLLQAHYDIEYLFSVPPHVFEPPPKVQSGVIRLTLKKDNLLGCSPRSFKHVVKTAFNQRRKTLKNSLLKLSGGLTEFPYSTLRPEQLDYRKFVELVHYFENQGLQIS
ncbi:MAG TPA: 16S rRNA (adenine(1518)-N(6)/adenine(1519)-N(6))-dimethyltransferase RsmA [Bacteroidia bacterium]|nr:16S rRNA (adenine(1518)-N(6)/adenine(1519)-N(6))-dimethyltransferase RsmA [Bacteroidia bacterium]